MDKRPSIKKIIYDKDKALFVVALALIVPSSCKPLTESTELYISKQEAIDVALESASMSRPETSGLQKKPSNINAEQMTLDEAVKRIHKNDQSATAYDPNMTVWFVTLEGLWLGEMSAPGIVPTPEPIAYHHYAIIMDAKTGLEIENSLSP